MICARWHTVKCTYDTWSWHPVVGQLVGFPGQWLVKLLCQAFVYARCSHSNSFEIQSLQGGCFCSFVTFVTYLSHVTTRHSHYCLHIQCLISCVLLYTRYIYLLFLTSMSDPSSTEDLLDSGVHQHPMLVQTSICFQFLVSFLREHFLVHFWIRNSPTAILAYGVDLLLESTPGLDGLMMSGLPSHPWSWDLITTPLGHLAFMD